MASGRSLTRYAISVRGKGQRRAFPGIERVHGRVGRQHPSRKDARAHGVVLEESGEPGLLRLDPVVDAARPAVVRRGGIRLLDAGVIGLAAPGEHVGRVERARAEGQFAEAAARMRARASPPDRGFGGAARCARRHCLVPLPSRAREPPPPRPARLPPRSARSERRGGDAGDSSRRTRRASRRRWPARARAAPAPREGRGSAGRAASAASRRRERRSMRQYASPISGYFTRKPRQKPPRRRRPRRAPSGRSRSRARVSSISAAAGAGSDHSPISE